MGMERGNMASVLFIQLVKFLFKLRKVIIIEPIQVMNATLLVEEAIGRIARQSNILLNGVLLVIRKVVVNTIGRGEVILCDDILPRLFWRPVGKVDIYDVVILEFCLEFVRLTQLALAGCAPSAPDVKIYYLTTIWLYNLVDDCFAVG